MKEEFEDTRGNQNPDIEEKHKAIACECVCLLSNNVGEP